MAYSKIDNINQTDADENLMIHIDTHKTNKDNAISMKLSDEREMHIVGTCDGCIHQHICKYKDEFDNFKSELRDVYGDARGSEFMDLIVNATCSYYSKVN